MKKDEAFPSAYWAASDVEERPLLLKILEVNREAIKQNDGTSKEKAVVYFLGSEKKLVLNAVNWDSIVEITGQDDTDDWNGQQIVLFKATTQFGGKTVPCIRVRAPKVAAKPAAKPATKAKPAQVQEVTEEDLAEIDSEIPY